MTTRTPTDRERDPEARLQRDADWAESEAGQRYLEEWARQRAAERRKARKGEA